MYRRLKTVKVDNVNIIKINNVNPLSILGTTISKEVNFVLDVLVYTVIGTSCNQERAPPLVA